MTPTAAAAVARLAAWSTSASRVLSRVRSASRKLLKPARSASTRCLASTLRSTLRTDGSFRLTAATSGSAYCRTYSFRARTIRRTRASSTGSSATRRSSSLAVRGRAARASFDGSRKLSSRVITKPRSPVSMSTTCFSSVSAATSVSRVSRLSSVVPRTSVPVRITTANAPPTMIASRPLATTIRPVSPRPIQRLYGDGNG